MNVQDAALGLDSVPVDAQIVRNQENALRGKNDEFQGGKSMVENTVPDALAQARRYIAAWSRRADDCGRAVRLLSDLLALVTTAEAERDAARRGPMDPLRFANAEHEAEHWKAVAVAFRERVAVLELEDAKAGPHIDRLVEMGDRLRERVAVLEPRVARLEAALDRAKPFVILAGARAQGRGEPFPGVIEAMALIDAALASTPAAPAQQEEAW